ncbi:hypothetical protein HMPREF1580_00345 [Gardnerella vaginalis JCP8070]|nr:hypothetical protein HMPREF1583_00585 [Gardnerella vaginalis JCP8151B]EPI59705.1 hypothetical protein HMPREF1579_00737 [Gardnerella vaginalis JCP8066]EPI60602.1 hypothetical protein HMPREF1580_00345 [Gardnerella vaginalis JCP8070]
MTLGFRAKRFDCVSALCTKFRANLVQSASHHSRSTLVLYLSQP